MNGFSVSIKEASIDLTPIMRVKLKDTANAVKLDDATNAGPVVITPVNYAVLAVHNENSENKDYELYVLIDPEGNKYVTGSPSFWDAFMDIWSELKDEAGEWSISIYKRDSKNYKGKYFLTCSVC